MRFSLLTFALLVAGIIALHSIYIATKRATSENGNDFKAYMIAADAIAQGQNPYRADYPAAPYLYPPIVALTLFPLALPPLAVSAALWAVLNCSCLAYVLLFALRPFRESLSKKSLATAILIFTLSTLAVFQQNLAHGQINFVVIAGLVGAYQLLQLRYMNSAALVAALAISVKLTPGLILVWHFWKRQWRFLAITLIALTLLFVVPLLALRLPLLETYQDMALALKIRSNPQLIAEKAAFSLEDLLGMGKTGAPWIVRLIAPAALGGALLAFLASGKRLLEDPRFRQLGFSTCLAAIVLVSPLSERHHLAFVLPLSWTLLLFCVSTNAFPRSHWSCVYAVHVLALAVGGKLLGPLGFLLSVLALFVSTGMLWTTSRRAPTQLKA